MIIGNAITFKSNDVASYGWRQLAVFQNVFFTSERIVINHKLPEWHRENAKRQAKQIRHCLIQAKEYFDAARAVSLSTRPALLYYCAMSLALAEILFKQTGDSRLEKLRSDHAAHGLTLKASGSLRVADPFESLATSLVAKPQVDKSGRPRGTFEVWRRSSREYPLCGIEATQHVTGASHGYRAIYLGADVEPPSLPQVGMNLLDCLVRLPQMGTTLSVLGKPIELVRGHLKLTVPLDRTKRTFELTIHPGPQHLIDKFSECLRFHTSANLNQINITEFPSGFILRVEETDLDAPNLRELPYSIMQDSENAYFSCRKEMLNEFGLLYVALHICGNLARYFPDKWLDHVEHRSSLCVAVERLMEVAMERLPLLCAAEFSGTLLVPEA